MSDHHHHYYRKNIDHDNLHQHEGYTHNHSGTKHHHHGPSDDDILIHDHKDEVYGYHLEPRWKSHEHYVVDDYGGKYYYGPANHIHESEAPQPGES